MNEEMNHVDPLFMRAYFYVYLCLRLNRFSHSDLHCESTKNEQQHEKNV